jgi:hypothetical protein
MLASERPTSTGGKNVAVLLADHFQLNDIAWGTHNAGDQRPGKPAAKLRSNLGDGLDGPLHRHG